MAMSPSTSKTNNLNRKRNLEVSTSGFTSATHEEFEHLPRSPVDRFFKRQKPSKLDLSLNNPFCSDDENDNDPKSPNYSPSAVYDPINDGQTTFRGFSYVGKIDDSEQNSEEEDDSAFQLKWVQYVANFMLHDIKKDKQMIPDEVMGAFDWFEEMLDDKGECFKVRKKFEEFWDGFLYYLENYDTSNMDENKELKEDIKKYFNIIAIRYDNEKRCEKLGIFLRSFDALNDEGEKIEFSEENLLNHFRLDKKMYGDVREKHVKKLFKKLSKVINNSLSLASPPSSAREKHVKKLFKKLSKVKNG